MLKDFFKIIIISFSPVSVSLRKKMKGGREEGRKEGKEGKTLLFERVLLKILNTTHQAKFEALLTIALFLTIFVNWRI